MTGAAEEQHDLLELARREPGGDIAQGRAAHLLEGPFDDPFELFLVGPAGHRRTSGERELEDTALEVGKLPVTTDRSGEQWLGLQVP